MAQTKKQRFRAEKRVKKAPAPPPPVKKKKVSSEPVKETGGSKKVLIGGGVFLALAGIVTTVVLVSNPFAPPAPVAATQTPPPTSEVADPNEMKDPSIVRRELIRDFRVSVDAETADKVSASCDTGASVTGAGRIKGATQNLTFTCSGVSIKVVKADSGEEVISLTGTPSSPEGAPRG